MKNLIKKMMQLERQLVFVKHLYKTTNDHLVAGFVLYSMREKKKSSYTQFENLFDSSFVQAVPILEDLHKYQRFFITW